MSEVESGDGIARSANGNDANLNGCCMRRMGGGSEEGRMEFPAHAPKHEYPVDWGSDNILLKSVGGRRNRDWDHGPPNA